jgi:hypothetical protein
MPQELGNIPEIVVGHITGGEVVLRDVTYKIDNPVYKGAPSLKLSDMFRGIPGLLDSSDVIEIRAPGQTSGKAFIKDSSSPTGWLDTSSFEPSDINVSQDDLLILSTNKGSISGVVMFAPDGLSYQIFDQAANRVIGFGDVANGYFTYLEGIKEPPIASELPIGQTPSRPPSAIEPIPVVPTQPAKPLERMVLFDRVNLNYLTAQPSDGLDMMNRNPQIEFVGSFDRNTAEIVADRLAANPPGNALEIKAKQIPAVLSELLATQSVIQSAAELLASREVVLRKLIQANRLLPNPTPEQMYDVAMKTYDAAATLPEPYTNPFYGVSNEMIQEAMQQQSKDVLPDSGYRPSEQVMYSAK